MTFWKLVGAIIVGNLLTGVAASILWALYLAAVVSSANDKTYSGQSAPAYQSSEPLVDQHLTKRPPPKARKLSPPDRNGCVKELAEESNNHC